MPMTRSTPLALDDSGADIPSTPSAMGIAVYLSCDASLALAATLPDAAARRRLTQFPRDSMVQHTMQELSRPFVLRVHEDLIGSALFRDDTLIHEDDAVGRLAREAHLM